MAGSGKASATTRMREPERDDEESCAKSPVSISSMSWRGNRATEATKPRKAAIAKANERWATMTSEAMITATATISQSEDHSLAPSSRTPRMTEAAARAGRLAVSGAARSAWWVKALPHAATTHWRADSSEERRVGKESVGTCRTRWSRYH